MELEKARQLIRSLIKSGKKHPDYDRVTALADKLQILITGENSDKLLVRHVSREDEAAFAQRVQLTKSITPAVSASVRVPFYKVARNQRIRRVVDMKDEGKTGTVKKMLQMFYGDKDQKIDGLDSWMQTRFIDLNFTDPNAWVVLEWQAPEKPTDIIQAWPFEVSAHEAVYFEIVNDETMLLLVKRDIMYPTVGSAASGEEVVYKKGVQYILYDKDFTVNMMQVEKAYLDKTGYKMGENQSIYEKANTATIVFLETWTEPKLGFVGARRVGYKRDLATRGRTFVDPSFDGMCYYDKSIKTVSEFDLTMSLHAFPQKVQVVSPCSGTKDDKCASGYTLAGNKCKVCDGVGFTVHKSAQDAIFLPMPKRKEDQIDINNIIKYFSPPIDLIKFQNDYIQQLKTEVHAAVFNSTVLVKKTTTASSEGGGTAPTQTATENDNDMQSVYDALQPFTMNNSGFWKFIVFGLAKLANVGDTENIDIDYIYPADPKLKNADTLLADLKNVNESGAPSFVKDDILADLAEIVFAGDTLGLKIYQVKRRFFPFNGKTEDEIAMLLGTTLVPQRLKVLYANFERIFSDIEAEAPDFWVLDKTPDGIKKQIEIVNDMVQKYVDELAAASPNLVLDAFKNMMGGGDTPPASGEDTEEGNNSNPEETNA
jgi:hypothetical protein